MVIQRKSDNSSMGHPVGFKRLIYLGHFGVKFLEFQNTVFCIQVCQKLVNIEFTMEELLNILFSS